MDVLKCPIHRFQNPKSRDDEEWKNRLPRRYLACGEMTPGWSCRVSSKHDYLKVTRGATYSLV